MLADNQGRLIGCDAALTTLKSLNVSDTVTKPWALQTDLWQKTPAQE
jgi:hypothetical protein